MVIKSPDLADNCQRLLESYGSIYSTESLHYVVNIDGLTLRIVDVAVNFLGQRAVSREADTTYWRRILQANINANVSLLYSCACDDVKGSALGSSMIRYLQNIPVDALGIADSDKHADGLYRKALQRGVRHWARLLHNAGVDLNSYGRREERSLRHVAMSCRSFVPGDFLNILTAVPELRFGPEPEDWSIQFVGYAYDRLEDFWRSVGA
ncbi:hypothetical protein Slin15195_G041350 [Septoria linicola]|uniref:Uncharacterized protein n=1 Tax=Septoria linicola TaxID=215465 RepID=A0A9Q9AU87_9PEZI|nr:hypothetical protein Slin14017_G044870 [Septoria linicola]USW50816.1 hypothetical protein Slin15195_G041350 [Septoria linicola]